MAQASGSQVVAASVDGLDIYRSYRRSPRLSLKHRSYFHAYTRLLERFRGRPVTFVEVGVLHGGSLFMWRDYLGPQARIIGVDFNPQARRWESDGFEIHIGDQASEAFWTGFFSAVGDVDVVLDDGGHTYAQQITTATACIPHIRDGGLLLVEDTHTSYMSGYGPRQFSFLRWVASAADQVNARFPGLGVPPRHPVRDCVLSITIYESIVAFEVDRRLAIPNEPVTNGAPGVGAEDFRHFGTARGRLDRLLQAAAGRWPGLRASRPVRATKALVVGATAWMADRLQARALKRYF